MVKFDFGSVLTVIAMALLLLVILIFMIIKFKNDVVERTNEASMYQPPTWTEVSDNE